MHYEPILILDEDDTPWKDLYSLKEFYDTINLHIEGVNEKPESIFVRISNEVYDTEDFDTITLGQVQFLVKRDN